MSFFFSFFFVTVTRAVVLVLPVHAFVLKSFCLAFVGKIVFLACCGGESYVGSIVMKERHGSYPENKKNIVEYIYIRE